LEVSDSKKPLRPLSFVESTNISPKIYYGSTNENSEHCVRLYPLPKKPQNSQLRLLIETFDYGIHSIIVAKDDFPELALSIFQLSLPFI